MFTFETVARPQRITSKNRRKGNAKWWNWSSRPWKREAFLLSVWLIGDPEQNSQSASPPAHHPEESHGSKKHGFEFRAQHCQKILDLGKHTQRWQLTSNCSFIQARPQESEQPRYVTVRLDYFLVLHETTLRSPQFSTNRDQIDVKGLQSWKED